MHGATMDGTETAAGAVTDAILRGIGSRIGRGLGKAGDPAEAGRSARLQILVHGDPAATSTEPPEGDRWVFRLGLMC